MTARRLVAAAAALTLSLTVAACSDDEPQADPTLGGSETDESSPTEKQESKRAQAVRLAEEQLVAAKEAFAGALADPQVPAASLEQYYYGSALGEAQQDLQERRAAGERLVNLETYKPVTGTAVNDVQFQKKGKLRAAVDMDACYHLGRSHFVDADGEDIPLPSGVAKKAKSRYVVVALEWPADSAADWRVSRDEGVEECDL